MDAIAIPVVLLCGGEGTRLRAVTEGGQKTLVDVADEPFLALLTRYLALQGFRRFVYAAGHRGEEVAALGVRMASSLGVEVRTVIEPERLGTGGAIRFAADRAVPGEDRVFVVNGDSLCEFDYAAMAAFHEARASAFTMALVAADPTSDGGFVRLDGDRILGFAEKDYHPDHSFLNAGTYLVERSLLDRIPTGRAVSIERDLLPHWTAEALHGYRTGSILHDIGTPERLAAFRRSLGARG